MGAALLSLCVDDQTQLAVFAERVTWRTPTRGQCKRSKEK